METSTKGTTETSTKGTTETSRAEQRNLGLRRWLWFLFDTAIWFPAVCGAAWLRFNVENTVVLARPTLVFAATACVAYVVAGMVLGPYRVGFRRDSSKETTDIGSTVLVTASGLLVWTFFAAPVIPPSVPAVAGVLALVGMFAARFFIPARRRRRAETGKDDQNVIAPGAGEPPLLRRKSVLMGMSVAGFVIASDTITARMVKPATISAPQPNITPPAGIITPPAGVPKSKSGAADVVSVSSYGAVGDGITDDTAAINAAILANPGKVLLFRAGRTYQIRADQGRSLDHGGGIQLNQARTTLSMHGATIRMYATSRTHYQMIDVTAPDCAVLGGKLIGDVVTHLGNTGEYGHGVSIGKGADRFTARDVYVTKCWGDGFFIWERPSDVSLKNCTGDDNRRQGLSIIDAIRPRVTGGSYINTGRTKYTGPGGGIDLEPDRGTARDVINAVITGVTLTGNRGPGLLSVSNGRSISAVITRCHAINNGAAGSSSGFLVDGAGNHTFKSCHSRGNTLDGWTIGSSVANTKLIGCTAKLNRRHGISDSGTGTQITGGSVL